MSDDEGSGEGRYSPEMELWNSLLPLIRFDRMSTMYLAEVVDRERRMQGSSVGRAILFRVFRHKASGAAAAEDGPVGIDQQVRVYTVV